MCGCVRGSCVCEGVRGSCVCEGEEAVVCVRV